MQITQRVLGFISLKCRMAWNVFERVNVITNLGNRLACMLVQSGVVSDNEQELYGYGFFLLLSRAIFFLVTVTFGAIWGVLWEGIAFYGLFALIRGYAGGIHASREESCFLWTTVAIFLSTGLIRWLEVQDRKTIALGLLLVGLLGVVLLSPLDVPGKPLSPEDRNLYRKRSLIVALGASGFSLCSAGVGWLTPLTIVSTALALESVLLTIGTVKTQKSAKMQQE